VTRAADPDPSSFSQKIHTNHSLQSSERRKVEGTNSLKKNFLEKSSIKKNFLEKSSIKNELFRKKFNQK